MLLPRGRLRRSAPTTTASERTGKVARNVNSTRALAQKRPYKFRHRSGTEGRAQRDFHEGACAEAPLQLRHRSGTEGRAQREFHEGACAEAPLHPACLRNTKKGR